MANEQYVNSSWRRATPLMMVVGHASHFHIADELLRAGADPNAANSILNASCQWHFEHLVPAWRYLAQVGWDVNSCDSTGQTALHKAAFPGFAAVVRVLLDSDADPGARDSSGMTALDVARHWNNVAVIKALARAA